MFSESISASIVGKKTKIDYSHYDFITADSMFYLKYPEEINIDNSGSITVQGVKFDSKEIRKITLGGIGLNEWNFKDFPYEILQFENLEYLSLKMRGFKSIPNEIINLKKLKTLDLQHSAVEELPPCISKLKNLEELILLYCKVNKLPKEIHQLRKLKYLQLGCTKFETIPKQLYKMHWLNRLILTNIKECEGDTKGGFYNKEDVEKLIKMLPKTKIFIKGTSK